MVDLHARLSPSGAGRWTSCPGSLRLSSDAPESPSSEAAREGTAAHAVLEICLETGVHPQDVLSEYMHGFPVDAEMRNAITYHFEYVQTYLNQYPGSTALFEEKLNPGMAMGRHDCWGTGDTVIINGLDELVSIDYKHGQGIVVEVEENKQLLLYAIGAAARYNWAQDQIKIVVVQPRAPHKDGPIREWIISTEELRTKWLPYFRERALETDDPDAPAVAGSHCRFCPAAGNCRARTEYSLAVAMEEFQEIEDTMEVGLDPKTPNDLTDDEIAFILSNAKLIEEWLAQVAVQATYRAERGTRIPGFKLVRRTTRRKWIEKSVDLLKKKLCELGLKKQDIIKEGVVTPKQAEDLLKGLNPDKVAALSELWTKPEGGLAIAPISDRRREVESLSDFTDLPDTEE